MPSSQPVQSVLRALDILELVARDAEGVSLEQISTRAGLNKSTAHNLVRTLKMRGYLEQGGNRRIYMGGALQELWLRRERLDIYQRAEKVVRKLHEQYPEGSINFCELVGTEISCRLRMAADCPGLLRRPRAHVLNPYASASGLCFQTFNENFRHRMDVLHSFDESSQHLWKSVQEFMEAREETLRQGVAMIQAGDRLRVAAPVTENFSIGFQLACGKERGKELCEVALAAAREIAGPRKDR